MTARVPLVDWDPVQAELPPAVQLVAFVELHVSVTVWPAVTDEDAAVNTTVGGDEAMRMEYRP